MSGLKILGLGILVAASAHAEFGGLNGGGAVNGFNNNNQLGNGNNNLQNNLAAQAEARRLQQQAAAEQQRINQQINAIKGDITKLQETNKVLEEKRVEMVAKAGRTPAKMEGELRRAQLELKGKVDPQMIKTEQMIDLSKSFFDLAGMVGEPKTTPEAVVAMKKSLENTFNTVGLAAQTAADIMLAPKPEFAGRGAAEIYSNAFGKEAKIEQEKNVERKIKLEAMATKMSGFVVLEGTPQSVTKKPTPETNQFTSDHAEQMEALANTM